MLNIPMPGNSGDAMLKGYDTMSTQMARLLQAKLQREQMAQQQNQFGQTFGLQQAKEARLLEQQPLQLGLLQEKMEKERALAQRARMQPTQKQTEMERVSDYLSGGDPAKKAAIMNQMAATKWGVPLQGEENLPTGSAYFKSLPKNVQAQENADQIKMQFKVNDARKAYHDLDQMDQIIAKNPDMARDFAYILGNPEDKSFMANLTRRYIDKNKLAQIEKFVKYSNDFVLSAGGGLGNNFTDAKLKALTLSKMHAGNTAEANKAIIQNYRERLKPMINYGGALKKARGKYTLPYFEESYTDAALGIRPLESLTDEELDAL